MANHQVFSLGDFPLECGMVLRAASLAYQTYGELDARFIDRAIKECLLIA